MIPRLLLTFVFALPTAIACRSAIPARDAADRSELALAPGDVLHSFAVSPDGSRVAYSVEDETTGRRRILIADVSRGDPTHREVPGSEEADAPFFSPDGRALGYFARNGIWRSAVEDGGDPLALTEHVDVVAGATWTPDGRIVFAASGGLMQIAASGGAVTPLTRVVSGEGELEHGWPSALHTGDVVFTVSERARDPHLEIVSPGGARTRLRVPVLGQAEFVATGHLVYSYLGNLMAVRFDPATSEIDGVPVTVATGIQMRHGRGTLGRASFSVSHTGTLVWLRSSREDAQSRLVSLGGDGSRRTLAAPPDFYQTPRLSPDGSKLAVAVRTGMMTRELRILDAQRPEEVLLTIAGGDNQSPAWVDDRRLTFGSNREGVQSVYIMSVSQNGGRAAPARDPELLFPANPSVARVPVSWTRPPRLLALYEIEPSSNRNVLVYRMGGAVTAIAATAANERSPSISPDGRWLAYVSDMSGRDEVHVRPLDGRYEPARLTSRGGTEPVWRTAGLFYRQGSAFLRLQMQGATVELPGRTQVGPTAYVEHDPGANVPAYDVTDDGTTFIVLKTAARPRSLRVVRNWGSELAATLP